MSKDLEELKGKEIFPPAWTKGGVRLPHKPTEKEMKNCGYAKRKNKRCLRKEGKRELIVGGKGNLVNCAICPYRSWNV